MRAPLCGLRAFLYDANMTDSDLSRSASHDFQSKIAAVRLLLILTAVTTMVGLFHGFFQAGYIFYLRDGASFSDLYPALVQTVWKGLGFLFLLAQSVFVYAVFALYRCTQGTPSAGPALASLLLFAIDISFSWSFQIYPELLRQVYASRVGSFATAVFLLMAYGLLFATIGRLTLRAFDRAMSAALGLYVLLNLTSILLVLIPATKSLGATPWGFFLIRQPIVLAFRGMTLYVLWRALQDLRRLASVPASVPASGPDDSAQLAADSAAANPREPQSAQAQIVIGALWLCGGLIVTIASYQVASSSSGGRFVMAYGAVVYGIVLIIRGILRAGQ